MNCSEHIQTESVRKCPSCKRFLCRSCIDAGHCRHCGWMLSRKTREFIRLTGVFWTVLIVVWAVLIGYGYSHFTGFASNGPIYFLLLTVSLLLLYIALAFSFKFYLEAGWLGKKHFCLILLFLLLAIWLFRFVVLPLSSYDID
ncbi:hypothetical protein [Paenibacillus vulneris]|uniref:B box-type domain-containing protein n=1 Tax=Paenibacillus vulneris TaxID=1133364 RepID=A0ABW3UI78_9BACL